MYGHKPAPGRHERLPSIMKEYADVVGGLTRAAQGSAKALRAVPEACDALLGRRSAQRHRCCT
eukprot:265435-Chlamydomonas_euryale.AAC.2